MEFFQLAGEGVGVGGRKLRFAEAADSIEHVQRRASLCVFRTECAQEIGNQAYRQDQANPAAADDGTAKVKPAAAEQEK